MYRERDDQIDVPWRVPLLVTEASVDQGPDRRVSELPRQA
jgi:hypothetical protein